MLIDLILEVLKTSNVGLGVTAWKKKNSQTVLNSNDLCEEVELMRFLPLS